MADQFLEPLIETDPDALVQIGVERIQEDYPDWQPAPAGITEATLGANAVITAEERDIATVVPRAIMRHVAVALFQFFPVEATQATANVTITAKDNAGYTLEEGTQFTIQATGDEASGFVAEDDIIIAPGATSVTVDLTAMIPGAASSGLTGEVLPVLSFEWVQSITLNGPTIGGQDDEDDDLFLNRFVRYVQTMAPRPVLARDIPSFATRTTGVFRVYVIDNYNPDDGTTNNEKMIAIYPVDESGNNVSAGVKTALAADLGTHRESNFQFKIADPSRTNVKIEYWVKIVPGMDPIEVQANIDAAINDYVNPATWGSSPEGEIPTWDVTETVLRRAKLAQVIEGVFGVHYIDANPTASGTVGIMLAKGAAAMGTIDVTLDGIAPLPVLTSLVGHVS